MTVVRNMFSDLVWRRN